MSDELIDVNAEQPSLALEDVEAILRGRGWLEGPRTPELEAWMADAAALLGRQALLGTEPMESKHVPPAAAREALAALLALIFHYDARTSLAAPDSHAVLARPGARDVVRELAHEVLDGPEINSDRFRQIVETLKTRTGVASRNLFQPIRLALAGRPGNGDLDRVILLLDRAAGLPFRTAVKNTRQRMLEFCAALD